MTTARRWFTGPARFLHPQDRTALLLLVFAAWLLLFAVQSLVRPVDGFMIEHVRRPSAAWLSGPLCATLLLHLMPILSGWISHVRLLYGILLVAVPLCSVWWIEAGYGCTDPLRRARLILTIVVLTLAALAISDLPYLSNDVYLYRAHGLMLSQHEASPYTASPAQVVASEDLQHVPWVRQKSPYGPLALTAFRLTTALSGNIAADFWRLKLLLGLPLLVLPVMFVVMRRFDARARLLGLAWIGLNPLLLLEIGQNAHLEGWVGLLLIWCVLALDRPTPGRIAAGGALCGLACAIKLSLLVAVPIMAVWIWSERRTLFSRQALGHALLFSLVFVITLVALYQPYWQGERTFIGLHQETTKVIRSFYALLGNGFGLAPRWIFLSSGLGNLVAIAAGMWIAIRRGNLPAALLCGLLLQAVFGRTFLQPWHFCPILMLVPFLNTAGHATAVGARGVPWLSGALSRRGLLVLSVSMLAGGYALLLGAERREDYWQTLSFLGMVVPPLAFVACHEARKLRTERHRARERVSG